MSSPGNAQHQLYTKASEVFGPENADTLMSGLVFRDDLATKADLDREIQALGSKIDLLGATMNGRIDETGARLNGRIDEMGASLNGRIDEMGASLNGRIDEMGASLNGRIDEMGAELRGEIQATVAQAVSEMNRSMRNWMGTVVVTIIAALVGTQLLP